MSVSSKHLYSHFYILWLVKWYSYRIQSNHIMSKLNEPLKFHLNQPNIQVPLNRSNRSLLCLQRCSYFTGHSTAASHRAYCLSNCIPSLPPLFCFQKRKCQSFVLHTGFAGSPLYFRIITSYLIMSGMPWFHLNSSKFEVTRFDCISI